MLLNGTGVVYLPYFQLTVLVQENVARLQVSVNNVGGVEILESTKHLVDEVLLVLDLQLLLGLDDTIQVGLHELTDKVDVSENLSMWTKKC